MLYDAHGTPIYYRYRDALLIHFVRLYIMSASLQGDQADTGILVFLSATYNNPNVGATLYVNPYTFCVLSQSQGSTCGSSSTPPLYQAPVPPAIVGTLLAGQVLTQVRCLKVLARSAPPRRMPVYQSFQLAA